jgi:hypothetical protein
MKIVSVVIDAVWLKVVRQLVQSDIPEEKGPCP